MRACNNCLKDGVTCKRVVVLAVVTDCEECNKQALLELDSLAENTTLPPKLLLAVPFPDVVHLGKSLKCSWSNWILELEGEMSNLVLLQTLRDCSDTTIRNKLLKLLSLESVLNKDRMAVEPIVHLTRTEVVSELEKIKFIVHTIAPEKYRF